MQVHRQSIHHRDLLFAGPDDSGQGRDEALVVGPPRMAGLEMAFHPELFPVAHDLIHVPGCRPGLQPQGIPGKIYDVFPLVLRKVESIPVRSQGVVAVEGRREGFGILEFHGPVLVCPKNTMKIRN